MAHCLRFSKHWFKNYAHTVEHITNICPILDKVLITKTDTLYVHLHLA